MIRSQVVREHIPTWPWVYLFKTAGDSILYIGKAKWLKKRLQHYFTPSTLWKQDMVAKAYRVEVLPVTSEQEALLLETNLIRTHKPVYNNLIKGETSYVYIKIPHEPYPNILLTRYKKNDKAIYLGPKLRKRELKSTLQLIRHLLRYRACTPAVFKQGHVCSDYFFDLCSGRCAYNKLSTSEENQQAGFTPIRTPEQAQQEYDQIIQSIISYFKGHTKLLETTIKHHIDLAIQRQNFERAAKLRDMFLNLQNFTDQQTVVLSAIKTGIYVMIAEQKQWYVRGILQLTNGVINDVITGKEHREDTDLDKLIQTIGREYEVELLYNQTQPLTYTASATTDKKFTKKEQKALEEHLSRFLEGYLHSHHFEKDLIDMDELEKLQAKFELPTVPRTIECADISHFSWDRTSGAVSAMKDGKLFKPWYRHYKIVTAGKHDDYAALAELLVRRSYAKGWRPDLFVIDGGVGQLGVVKRLIQEDIAFTQTCWNVTFVSLGKGSARTRKGKQSGEQEILHVLKGDLSIKSYELTYDPIDKLLILLRDEAHRFANKYRKQRMSRDIL